MTDPTVSVMPRNAHHALEMWDAGDPVPAFQVETEGASQEDLWGAAFEAMRRPSTAEVQFDPKFTQREIDTIKSIVAVSQISGWAKMVASHVHALSPALMIVNPNAKTKESGAESAGQ